MYDQYTYNTETSNIDTFTTIDLFNHSYLEMDSMQATFEDLDDAIVYKDISQLHATELSDEDLGDVIDIDSAWDESY